MAICKNCGNEVNSKFCPHCGAANQPDNNQCPSCGAILQEKTNFCPECGYSFINGYGGRERTVNEILSSQGNSRMTVTDEKIKVPKGIFNILPWIISLVTAVLNLAFFALPLMSVFGLGDMAYMSMFMFQDDPSIVGFVTFIFTLITIGVSLYSLIKVIKYRVANKALIISDYALHGALFLLSAITMGLCGAAFFEPGAGIILVMVFALLTILANIGIFLFVKYTNRYTEVNKVVKKKKKPLVVPDITDEIRLETEKKSRKVSRNKVITLTVFSLIGVAIILTLTCFNYYYEDQQEELGVMTPAEVREFLPDEIEDEVFDYWGDRFDGYYYESSDYCTKISYWFEDIVFGDICDIHAPGFDYSSYIEGLDYDYDSSTHVYRWIEQGTVEKQTGISAYNLFAAFDLGIDVSIDLITISGLCVGYLLCALFSLISLSVIKKKSRQGKVFEWLTRICIAIPSIIALIVYLVYDLDNALTIAVPVYSLFLFALCALFDSRIRYYSDKKYPRRYKDAVAIAEGKSRGWIFIKRTIGGAILPILIATAFTAIVILVCFRF